MRHECGHAIDHAYRFSSREDWRAIFGSPEAEYAPETYQPRPYSKGFVRHLPNWYAQAHPDEDFAETFAVWLSMKPEEWREQYRRLEGAGETQIRAFLDGGSQKQRAQGVAADGVFPMPASFAKLWRDTMRNAANYTPRISPIFTTPICGLYSTMASRTENPPRASCARTVRPW